MMCFLGRGNRREPPKFSRVEWDSKPHLFAFTNKVFDLRTGQEVEPDPLTFIRTTTGYAYEEPRKEDVAAVQALLASMVDTEDKKKSPYLLRSMAAALWGTNQEERMQFWTGSGRNGKGTLQTLLQRALGNYAAALPCEYFTGQARGDGRDVASALLVSLLGKRLVFVGEPSASVAGSAPKWNAARFKSWTGRDPIAVRDLYKGADDVMTLYPPRTFALTNHVPAFDYVDQPTLLRVVNVEFPFNFMPSDAYNAGNARHRRQDPTVKDAILNGSMHHALVKLLLGECPLYVKEGLPLPKEVLEDGLRFRGELDVVGAWASERLEASPDGECVPQSSAYEDFKGWAAGAEVDVRTVSSAAMGKRLGELGYERKKRNVGMALEGVRLKNSESEPAVSVLRGC